MWDDAARGFAAMGSEARLRVLRTLVRAGAPGLSVGEIQARTGLAPSTLAHHLRTLAAGGVIVQERQGRTVLNRACFDALRSLADFILDDCCADSRGKAGTDG